MNYAVPFFLVLIIIEIVASYVLNKKVNRLFDSISSLSSGFTNVIKDVLGLVVVILSYQWFYDQFAIFHIESTIALYILAFIGIDFAGYWVHRWSHEINVFWNRHIIHHSSEEFNLSCALRQSVSEIFALFTFTYIPMALLGIPTKVIAIVGPIQLFAQFWYHTQLIGKMGWMEYILVTPSHHRVHHAINQQYMDRNYGQIFIIWDKIFGSFQPEIADNPPVYGVTRAVKTWNPWIINYQHIWLLIKDAWRTNSFRDKLRIWFMPTGWRPEDVSKKYPIDYIRNVYDRTKYDTAASSFFKVWTTIQFVITLVLMMYFFNSLGEMSTFHIMWYGIMLFVSIYAYTSLMDGHIQAIPSEVLKAGIALWLFYDNGYSWFGIENLLPFGNQLVILYFSTSLILTVYFYVFDRPKEMSIKEVHVMAQPTLSESSYG